MEMSYPHNYRSGLRFLVMAAQQRRLIESTHWRAALGTLVRTLAALSMQAVGLAAACRHLNFILRQTTPGAVIGIRSRLTGMPIRANSSLCFLSSSFERPHHWRPQLRDRHQVAPLIVFAYAVGRQRGH